MGNIIFRFVGLAASILTTFGLWNFWDAIFVPFFKMPELSFGYFFFGYGAILLAFIKFSGRERTTEEVASESMARCGLIWLYWFLFVILVR